MAKATIPDEHVREAAYHMWMNEGAPEGRDQEFWYRALEALAAGGAAKKKAPAKKAAAKKPAAKKPAVKAAAKPAAKKAPAKKPAGKAAAAKA